MPQVLSLMLFHCLKQNKKKRNAPIEELKTWLEHVGSPIFDIVIQSRLRTPLHIFCPRWLRALFLKWPVSGSGLKLVKDNRATLLRWPSLQWAKPHISHLTSAISADSRDNLQKNRQEGKLLTQVCALKAKHFHLCNQIAERAEAAPLSWAGQSKTLRSTKWWMAMPLILQRDWLCLLGHCGAGCVKWSPLCGVLAQPQLWCRR